MSNNVIGELNYYSWKLSEKHNNIYQRLSSSICSHSPYLSLFYIPGSYRMDSKQYSRTPLLVLLGYVIISFALVYFFNLKQPGNKTLLRWCLYVSMSWLVIPVIINLSNSLEMDANLFKHHISVCIIILSLGAQLSLFIHLSKTDTVSYMEKVERNVEKDRII